MLINRGQKMGFLRVFQLIFHQQNWALLLANQGLHTWSPATYVILSHYLRHSRCKHCSEHILSDTNVWNNSEIFFLLTTHLIKGCKCRCKRTIFHIKCELLECCSYCKHFDQIHHSMWRDVFGRSLCRIEKNNGS